MSSDDDFELYGTEADKVKAANATKAKKAAEDDAQDGRNDSVSAAQLRAFIERIENMEDEKAVIAADIKEIYAEAKGNGYDTKTIRTIVRMRKQDASEREEQRAMTELYLSALGMM